MKANCFPSFATPVWPQTTDLQRDTSANRRGWTVYVEESATLKVLPPRCYTKPLITVQSLNRSPSQKVTRDKCHNKGPFHSPCWRLGPCPLHSWSPGFRRRCWGWFRCRWTPGSWLDRSRQTRQTMRKKIIIWKTRNMENSLTLYFSSYLFWLCINKYIYDIQIYMVSA